MMLFSATKAFTVHVWLSLMMIVGLVGLAGCSEIKFLSGSAKEIKDMAAPATTTYNAAGLTLITEGETYKVGSPYQIAGQWYYPKEDYSYVEEGIASWYGPGFHAKRTANGAVFDQEAITAAHRTLPMPSLVRVTNLENGLSLVVKVNDRGPFARNRIIDLSHKVATILQMDKKGTALVRVEILADESRKLADLMQGNAIPGLGGKDSLLAGQPQAAPTGGVSRQSLSAVAGATDKSSEASSKLSQSPLPVTNNRVDSLARLTNLETTLKQETVTANEKDIYVQAGAFSLYENAYKLKIMLDGEKMPTLIEQYNTSTRPLFRVKVGPTRDSDQAANYLTKLQGLGFADAHLVTGK